jgi:hypothetical protein
LPSAYAAAADGSWGREPEGRAAGVAKAVADGIADGIADGERKSGKQAAFKSRSPAGDATARAEGKPEGEPGGEPEGEPGGEPGGELGPAARRVAPAADDAMPIAKRRAAVVGVLRNLGLLRGRDASTSAAASGVRPIGWAKGVSKATFTATAERAKSHKKSSRAVAVPLKGGDALRVA